MFIAAVCDNGWLLFLYNAVILPDNPVSNVTEFWKHFGLFVIIQSTQGVFSGFLKQVLSLTWFLQPQI